MTDHDSTTSHPSRSGDHLEEYAGGYITAWLGRIPYWLLAVYLVLFVWALYYLVEYWGGVGPGRPN